MISRGLINRDLSHQVFHGKPQTAVCSYAFAVSRCRDFEFSKAFSSVQFSPFLFSQNIIQYENTYRNCKVAIKGGRKKPEGL